MYAESRPSGYHSRSHRNTANSNVKIASTVAISTAPASNSSSGGNTGPSSITPPPPRGLSSSHAHGQLGEAVASGTPTTNGVTSSGSSPLTSSTLPFQPPRPRTASPRSPEDFSTTIAAASSPAALASAKDTRKISGLQRIVRDANLVHTLPLSELRQLPDSNMVRVGFDGNALMQRLAEVVHKRDPLAVFTITIPTALYDELEILKKEICQITSDTAGPTGLRTFEPVFVFDGIPLSPAMDPVHTPHPSPPNEILPFLHCQGRADAVPANVRDLVADRFRFETDLESYLLRQLNSLFKDVFRAPYHAWAQLSSFFSGTNRYISEVCGCLELLAFPGVERVITRFHPEAGTFDVVERAAVIQAINHRLAWENRLTLRDLSYWILADTLHRPYRLLFMNMPAEESLGLLSKCEALPEGRGRGYSYSKQFPVDQYRLLQANFALLDAPVLTCDAACLPLYTVYGVAPFSSLRLSEVYGAPLPTVLYYCQFSGHMDPVVLGSISQGIMTDRWPLIDSALCRKILQLMLILRFQACYQILQAAEALSPPTTWFREYAQTRGTSVQDKWTNLRRPENLGLGEWDLREGAPVLLKSHLYFSDVLSLANRSMHGGEDLPVYTTVSETTASILLKLLDQLGYFTHALLDDLHTGLGEVCVLSQWSHALTCFTCDTLGEYGVLLIELLRTMALNDHPIHVTPNPQHYQPSYPTGVRFAARLLSIVHINVHGAWTGPFDPEMAAFGMVSRTVSGTLRNMVEALTIATFCTHRTQLPLSEMRQVREGLPFSLPTEFGAGHVIMYALQNPCTLQDLEKVFPECFRLREDMEVLFGFWYMAIQAIARIQGDKSLKLDTEMVQCANVLVCDTAIRLDAEKFGYIECVRDVLYHTE